MHVPSSSRSSSRRSSGGGYTSSINQGDNTSTDNTNNNQAMSDYAIGLLTMLQGIKGTIGSGTATKSLETQLANNKISTNEANYIRGKLGL